MPSLEQSLLISIKNPILGFEELDRLDCEDSLAHFIKCAWHVIEPGQPYVHGWHIDAMAEHLEALTNGQINRLLINIPPGMSKSLMVGVFWPAWEWGPRGMASMRYVAASHSHRLSIRDNLRMRRLVSSEWYQSRWPVPLTKDQNEKLKFENEKTGFREAMAMASMTGSRGDRVILDDPHSVEGALSEASRETDLREFRETVPTRLNNPDRSAIIVIKQRLHENDISGVILSEDLGYVHLCLPMEFEPARRCITSIGFRDPRKEEGELLFPERFPRGVVDRDKRVMGSAAVAGQFQQRPTPRGGGLIKGSWFSRGFNLPKIEYRKIFADTAQKVLERNDFSVFQCWGYGEGGKIYLLDQIRGKWEAPELRRRAIDFWNKHSSIEDDLIGPVRQMLVEDKSSGTGLIQDIASAGKIPVKGIERTKDKLTRVMDVVSYIESGLVCLHSQAPWINDFIAECESFTADGSHAHDDQIDPMCDAINDMLVQKTNKMRFYFG